MAWTSEQKRLAVVTTTCVSCGREFQAKRGSLVKALREGRAGVTCCRLSSGHGGVRQRRAMRWWLARYGVSQHRMRAMLDGREPIPAELAQLAADFTDDLR